MKFFYLIFLPPIYWNSF